MVLCIVCDLHLAENHMPRGLKMALSASGTLNSPASRMSSILEMGWHFETEHVESTVICWFGIQMCMDGDASACLLSDCICLAYQSEVTLPVRIAP